MCKLLIRQIGKLLTMLLDYEVAGMIHIVLLQQNWDKIFLYTQKKMSGTGEMSAIFYKNG